MSDLTQADIDALLAAVTADAQAEADAVGHATRVQNVDFRRPSKFSRDQLHTLEMLHDQFARLGGTHLSGALRCAAGIEVLGAEQVTFGEFIASLPSPALIAIVELEPLGTNALCAFDLPLVFTAVDRLLGGVGATTHAVRELTDIELALARTLVTNLLTELSAAWGELVGVDFRLRGFEMNPQFVQVAPPTELSVLLSFGVQVHEISGVMALCLPYRAIETVVPRLTVHSYYSGGRALDDDGLALRDSLDGVEIEVRVEIGGVELTLDELLALRPGALLRLGVAASDGARMLAGAADAYRVVPGRAGKALAVQVQERMAEGDR